MAKKVIIVGAVALGPKVASRLRRLDPEADILLIDRDDKISYGGCGMPYYIGGDVNDIEDLYSTTAHVIRDKDFFQNYKRIKVMTRVEATRIDRREHRLAVRHLDSGEEQVLEYDKLVLATGAMAVKPPVPGVELDGVFTVSDLHDAEQIKSLMTQGKVGSAVVIGGGAIGLEIAEALTDLWGITTTLVEMEDQVLPTLLGKCIARVVEHELIEKGVRLLLSERVSEISGDDASGCLCVKTSAEELPADIVIVAAGVRANTKIAADAGIAIGRTGGILVDRKMQTSDPDIYAGGDCIEIRNLISGENMPMALGSLANRQGRIIASNINGGSFHFTGAVGTFCVKVFDFGICKAGLTFRQARENGYDPVYAVVSQHDHAHFYPTSEFMYISLLADRKSRKILGIEAAGKHGDAVKARVDSIAVLLQHGVTIDEVCSLEVGYAPPFASAMDVVNNAGNALDNILSGRNRPIDVTDFVRDFRAKKMRVLDIRGEKDAKSAIDKFGDRWLNIPQGQLSSRIAEVPVNEPLVVFCDTGARSYEAQVLLDAAGITDTRHVQGGKALIMVTDPTFFD